MGSCCITPPVLLNLAAKKIFDLVFMPVSRPVSVEVQLKSFTLLPNPGFLMQSSETAFCVFF